MSDDAFLALKAQLTQAIAAALKQNVMTNRGTFPPFRVAATAQLKAQLT